MAEIPREPELEHDGRRFRSFRQFKRDRTGPTDSTLERDMPDEAQREPLRWSCGAVVRPGETYREHVQSCLRRKEDPDV